MEQLKNFGFEDGIPANWLTSSTGTAHKYIYTQTGRIDGVSVAIEYVTREEGKIAAWTQTVQIDNTRQYKLSGWMETQNIVGSGASIKVDWKDYTGNNLSTSAIATGIAGTTPWTYFEGEITPDENAVNATVVLELNDCSGKVSFDDLSFLLINTRKYYVATNGNDSNIGTEYKPWRTISRAVRIDSPVAAGDIIYVKTGTYHEVANIQKSGIAGEYIALSAYPGHIVTIDGTGLSMPNWQGLINVDAKKYLRISGFKVINSPQAGIHIDRSTDIIVERNNVVKCRLSSIKIGFGHCRAIAIDGNTVDREYFPDPRQEVISISNTDNIEIKNNHVLQNGNGEGIDLKDGVTYGKVYNNIVENCRNASKSFNGIYLDAQNIAEEYIEVYNNMVRNCGEGIRIGSEGIGTIRFIKVYNNILYDNTANGINISSYSYFNDGPIVNNILVINNTLYHNGTSPWSGGISIEGKRNIGMRIDSITIRNNIVIGNALFQIRYTEIDPYVTNIVSDHNLVIGDPKFIDVVNNDFHLKETSPAINAGSMLLAPAFDFDYKERSQGFAFDIGAYEY